MHSNIHVYKKIFFNENYEKLYKICKAENCGNPKSVIKVRNLYETFSKTFYIL